MEHQNQEQQVQWRRDKCKSFAAKATVKERYRKYCKLAYKYSNSEFTFHLLDRKSEIHQQKRL
jgi:hypothetical protein